MKDRKALTTHRVNTPTATERKMLVSRNLTVHGPRTESGKAITRLNAAKHGIEARTMVLPHLGETEQGWRMHLKAVAKHYQSRGYVEEEIVCRIAEILWRLRRVDRYRHEKTLLGYEQADNWAMIGGTVTPEQIRRGASLPDSRSLYKADGHEQHLTKMLIILSKELRRLQAQRGIITVWQVEMTATSDS